MSLKTKVAIDGPAGAGKSTISKKAAEDLGLVYVDTGAMYRAVALFAFQKKINFENIDEITRILDEIVIDLDYKEGALKVSLNGCDVSEDIRREEIGKGASAVAKIPEVRSMLVKIQRKIASEKSVVMDGRDIGTHVLPDAEVKIYLTADSGERARRRYKELSEKGIECSLEKIKADIEKRDYDDMHREVSPLKKAEDAVVLDTTDMTLEESIDAVKRLIVEKQEKEL